MKMMLELRYAVLLTLLMLLWLSLEYMVGLHDKYIGIHPYVSMLALAIPVVVSWRAVKTKREELKGVITFKQAFITGILVVLFSAALAVPMQLLFHLLVNPDFFDNMIAYSVTRAEELKMDATQARLHATMYFNLQSYIIQGVFITLVAGSLIAFVTAFVMRTKK